MMSNTFNFDVGSSTSVVVSFVNSKDSATSCLVKFTATSAVLNSSMGKATPSVKGNALTLTTK